LEYKSNDSFLNRQVIATIPRLGYENTPFALPTLVLTPLSTYYSHTIFAPIRSYSSSSPPRGDFVPDRFYTNADTLKEAILNENKSKSGVYHLLIQ
jgi:hypothetical protein